MVTETFPGINFGIPAGSIDCACLIHGSAYSWDYVDRLYSMLTRHITPGIRLHVYTEANRDVPAPMIKHALPDWSLTSPKKVWWYKLELFNTAHHLGHMLYFDLDTVVTGNLDWIWQLNLQYYWAVRDFKYIWRPTAYNINTSIMWFHTARFEHVYNEFIKRSINQVTHRYQGDQDFVNEVVDQKQRQFLDINRIQSWRWQALDGGFDFGKRSYLTPGTGTTLTDQTSLLIFHGRPKPVDVQDPVIAQHWI